jgi:hypothetical protein
VIILHLPDPDFQNLSGLYASFLETRLRERLVVEQAMIFCFTLASHCVCCSAGVET